MTRIYDQFTTIVAHVATKTGIPTCYLWGHPIEVIQILTDMTQNITQSDLKYPLVALFTDIEETKGKDLGTESEVKLHLIIATLTLPKYSSVERATINFKPVLYPIYDQLLKSICISGNYLEHSWQKIEHTKVDRFFWGKNGLYLNTGNVFKDYLDAIEIQNLKLTLKKQC